MKENRTITFSFFVLLGLLLFIFLLFISQTFAQTFYVLLGSLKSVWDFGPNFLRNA